MLLLAGRTNVQKLLSGDAAGKKIAKIIVGTNSTPVSESDTTITNPFSKAVGTVDYLSSGYVQFNITLDAGDPAMLIQEVGLLSDDNVLCYRKVIPPVNKVAGATYSVSFRIKVQ
ncbi:hypothetical protein [Chitinophaga sp. sic0106]|uniref:hypothetical protein n=1 Tax=Chitinophaga sp. sic0106 TaxID=2854785 RepID=UPI001C439293|nr:hypothetical protein [Chitinophaga sp. sic0106]MBV7529046.1 hypothetical protein [Chitinophaga sp. sic0106]